MLLLRLDRDPYPKVQRLCKMLRSNDEVGRDKIFARKCDFCVTNVIPKLTPFRVVFRKTQSTPSVFVDTKDYSSQAF